MKLTWAENQHVEVTWLEHDDPDAPVVVIWPAFGAPASYYRHLTPSLRAAGLSTLVVEYPGRDRADGINRHTAYGYDDLAVRVHAAVMREARTRHPNSKIVLLGHSLGGHVSLFAAALAQHRATLAEMPDAVILAASASPYWRGYGLKGIPRSFAGTAMMAWTSRLVGYWPGDRLKFWGRQSKVLVQDWAHIARTGRIEPRGAQQDYEQALHDFHADVLAISLPEDVLAPVGALHQLLELIPNAPVERWHAPVRLGHIQWVKRHELVVPVIAEWILRERHVLDPAGA